MDDGPPDMDSVNSDLTCWYQKIQHWYDFDSVDLPAATDVLDRKLLVEFLQVLSQALSARETVEDVLSTFPSAGMFLSRVVTIPVLVSDPGVCKWVITCLLRFCTSGPTSPVQCRANTWVTSQMRHLCSGSLTSVTSRVMEVTGSTATEHAQKTLDIISDALASGEGFSELHPFYKCLTPVKKADHASTRFCKRVVSIWRQDRAALEREVLRLVSACTSLVPGQVSELLQSRETQTLVFACATHSDLYHAVFSMLRQIQQDSESPHIMWLMHQFHQAVSKSITCSDKGPGVTVVSLFPINVQSLVQMLLVNPQDLTKSVCEHHMTQIDLVYTKTQSHLQPEELEDLRLKYLTWKFTVVSMCLLGSDTVLDSAVHLLQLFYDISPPSLSVVKSLVLDLRRLRLNSNLTPAAVETLNFKAECTLSVLLGQIWLLCLLVAEADHLVWRSVFNCIPHCSIAPLELCILKTVVETLEVVHNFCPVWVKDSVNKNSLSHTVNQMCTEYMDDKSEERSRKESLENCLTKLKQFGIKLR